MPTTCDVVDSRGQAIAIGDRVTFEHEQHGNIVVYVCQIKERSVIGAALVLGPSLENGKYLVPADRVTHTL